MPSPEVVQAVDRLIELAGYTEIAEHNPGRLRLRIKPRGLMFALNLNVAELAKLRLSIRGILGAKADLPARSLVIDYDPKLLPKELWELLVRANASPKVEALVRQQLLTRLSEDDLGALRKVSERIEQLQPRSA